MGLYTFVDINKKGSVQTTDTARALLARYHKGQPNRPAECSGVIEVRPAIQSLGNATPYKNDYTVLATGISRTLMACSYKHVPQVALNNELAAGQVRIRRLTPRECFRLQGFADEQFDKAATVNSETQLYKQAGNAVTVNVVEAIWHHIKEVASKME
nr:MAG TPA: Cytosine specific methyltransferase [Caudoviricetes sp.]